MAEPYPQIQPLADDVINQIAAGEVIERPASVVKELMENSIDAGADAISIDCYGGGIELIRVSDNGRGIPADQLHLALTRHCTSKLREAEDLAGIGSLGFRGEALASIASVACVDISSRSVSAKHGWQLVAGAAELPQPAAHPFGTTVCVADLFANTPVRRRFLKREKTEWLHILQLVRRLAFSRPDLAIRLRHNGQTRLNLAAADDDALPRRLESLFGAAFMQQCQLIDEVFDGVRISGCVGRASAARSHNDLQYFSVNGRAVRDRNLLHAARRPFEDSIATGRYPAFALAIELDTGMVDVNVHPTKAEVRFTSVRTVHDAIYAAVRHALEQDGHIEALAGPAATPRRDVYAHAASGGRRPAMVRDVPRPLVAGMPQQQALALACGRWLLAQRGGDVVAVDALAGIRLLTLALFEPHVGGEVLESRPLLVPETLRLDNAASARLDTLAQFGLIVEPIGPGQFALRRVPVKLVPVDSRKLAQGIACLSNIDHATLAALVADAWLAPVNRDQLTQLLLRFERELGEPERNAITTVLDDRRLRLLTGP